MNALHDEERARGSCEVPVEVPVIVCYSSIYIRSHECVHLKQTNTGHHTRNKDSEWNRRSVAGAGRLLHYHNG